MKENTYGPSQLRDALKNARLVAELTQEEAATRIGKNKSYVSRVESGREIEMPKFDSVALLAFAYGKALDELAAEAGLPVVRHKAVTGTTDPPNADLDATIQADYYEAASIVQKSPRSAAALLRLCVQRLCRQLGQPGGNIDADIAALVEQGLPVMIQQALRTVRVIGNEAVRPGELDLKDDTNTALALFALVNLIANNRISEPKHIAALFRTLPEAGPNAAE